MSELAILLSFHGIAIVAGVALMVLALKEDADDPLVEGAGAGTDGDGDGGIRRPGEQPPRGGPPLPRSGPSRVRLREPGRLADHYAWRPRRGPVEPHRPHAPARSSPSRS